MPFVLDSKSNKQILKNILKVLILITIVLTVAGAYYLNRLDSYNIGKNLGLLATAAFLITITPGILKRLGSTGGLKQVQILLMYSRTQLGLLMFFLAFGHYILAYIKPTVIPAIQAGGQANPELYITLGLFAFVLTGLLAVTSNTQSRKFMGKWWIWLHSTVYLILWLIFLHVALGSKNMLILILLVIFGALQIMSLVYARLNKKIKTELV